MQKFALLLLLCCSVLTISAQNSKVVGTWVYNDVYNSEVTTFTFKTDGMCTYSVIQNLPKIYADTEAVGTYTFNENAGIITGTLTGTQKIYDVSGSTKTLKETKLIGGTQQFTGVKVTSTTLTLSGKTYQRVSTAIQTVTAKRDKSATGVRKVISSNGIKVIKGNATYSIDGKRISR